MINVANSSPANNDEGICYVHSKSKHVGRFVLLAELDVVVRLGLPFVGGKLMISTCSRPAKAGGVAEPDVCSDGPQSSMILQAFKLQASGLRPKMFGRPGGPRASPTPPRFPGLGSGTLTVIGYWWFGDPSHVDDLWFTALHAPSSTIMVSDTYGSPSVSSIFAHLPTSELFPSGWYPITSATIVNRTRSPSKSRSRH